MADAGGNVVKFDGATWGSPVNIDPRNYANDGESMALSCVSTTFCMAARLHDAAHVRQFNGSTWAPATTIASIGLRTMTCASPKFCVAIDNDSKAHTFYGTSWSSPVRITASTGSTSISCPNPTFCVAMVQEHAIEFNGSTWVGYTPISIETSDDWVSCPTVDACTLMTSHQVARATPASFLVSAALSPGVMPLGSTAKLTVSVNPASAGQALYLQRYYSGAWHNVMSRAVSSSSSYAFALKPTARGIYRYRAYKPASGALSAGYSVTSYLYVGIYKVAGALVPTAMTHGSTAHFSGSVAPARAGNLVYLQRYYSGAWHNVVSQTLSASSGYDFAFKINSVGTYTYRVYKSGDSTYSAGTTASRSIKVT